MSQFFTNVDFVWISDTIGGHRREPWQGMRCEIVSMQCLAPKVLYDVTCTEIEMLEGGLWRAKLSSVFELVEIFDTNQQIILKNGFRVLAVGKITQFKLG